MLQDRDRLGAANIGLVGLTARYALDHGLHVIIEGILYADRYADMLLGLRRDGQFGILVQSENQALQLQRILIPPG